MLTKDFKGFSKVMVNCVESRSPKAVKQFICTIYIFKSKAISWPSRSNHVGCIKRSNARGPSPPKRKIPKNEIPIAPNNHLKSRLKISQSQKRPKSSPISKLKQDNQNTHPSSPIAPSIAFDRPTSKIRKNLKTFFPPSPIAKLLP